MYRRPLIISAGFPCQDGSTANSTRKKDKGVDGTRTGLVWEAIRIVDEMEPEYLFLENVAGLLNRGWGWGRIVKALTERGYLCWWRIVSAAAFGFPFEGKRILAVAFSPTLGLGLAEVESFDRLFSQNTAKEKEQHFTGEIGSLLRPENYQHLLAEDNGLPKWLVERRLNAIGNSIQPIFSKVVFKTIKEFHETIIPQP